MVELQRDYSGMDTDGIDFPASTSTTGLVESGWLDFGQISQAGDVDWFKVSLAAGGAYRFQIEAGTINGLFDPQLAIYSASNERVAIATIGQGFQLKYVDLTPATSGNYYLAASGDSGNYGSYQLSVLTGTTLTVIPGTSGNDALGSTSGNDFIDGGSGIDSAIYFENRINFTVTSSGTGFIVTDTTGANGTDTLANVERLSFADGSLGLDISGTSGQMYRLYKAAFNRIPDAPGLGWNIGLVDNGLTLAQMSAAFVASAEFTSTYGALSNTQFLDRLYLNVLGRSADPVGAAWNLNLLDTNTVDRPGMLAAYSESAENQAAVIGQIQDGIWFT